MSDVCGVRLVDVLRPDRLPVVRRSCGCARPEGDAEDGPRPLQLEQRWDQIYPKKAEDDGPEPFGRAMRNCVGSHPPIGLKKGPGRAV